MPATHDEVARLGTTLNELLDRIEEGLVLTHATVVGLLGREVPAELGWDKVRLVLKLTGRAPLTDGDAL